MIKKPNKYCVFIRNGSSIKCLFQLAFFLLLITPVKAQNSLNYVDFVNPFIGTKRMGHTFPGATVPFGMVQLSPDTDTVSYEKS